MLAMAARRIGSRRRRSRACIVTTIPFGPRMADAEPATMLAAKFSIPYAVAAALVLGRADVGAFEAPALADPRIRDLAAPGGGHRGSGDVAAAHRLSDRAASRSRSTDGRTLSGSTTVVRGDFERPVPAAEVVEKFIALTAGPLGADRAREVAALVERADTLKDVRDLTGLLAP